MSPQNLVHVLQKVSHFRVDFLHGNFVTKNTKKWMAENTSDTENDALEHLSPFKYGHFGYLSSISGVYPPPKKKGRVNTERGQNDEKHPPFINHGKAMRAPITPILLGTRTRSLKWTTETIGRWSSKWLRRAGSTATGGTSGTFGGDWWELFCGMKDFFISGK